MNELENEILGEGDCGGCTAGPGKGKQAQSGRGRGFYLLRHNAGDISYLGFGEGGESNQRLADLNPRSITLPISLVPYVRSHYNISLAAYSR